MCSRSIQSSRSYTTFCVPLRVLRPALPPTFCFSLRLFPPPSTATDHPAVLSCMRECRHGKVSMPCTQCASTQACTTGMHTQADIRAQHASMLGTAMHCARPAQCRASRSSAHTIVGVGAPTPTAPCAASYPGWPLPPARRRIRPGLSPPACLTVMHPFVSVDTVQRRYLVPACQPLQMTMSAQRCQHGWRLTQRAEAWRLHAHGDSMQRPSALMPAAPVSAPLG